MLFFEMFLNNIINKINIQHKNCNFQLFSKKLESVSIYYIFIKFW